MDVKRNILKLVVLFIYIGLPFLIFIGLIPFDYKFHTLTIGGIIVYAIMKVLGFKNRELGIKEESAWQSIRDVFPVTFLFVIIGLLMYQFGYTQRFEINENLAFFLFYVFISCPIQELLYRGVLTSIGCGKVSNTGLVIVSSFLYSYIHIIYHDFLTLVITFMIGVIWHFAYLKTNNLIGVTISHIILGILTISIGFIQ